MNMKGLKSVRKINFFVALFVVATMIANLFAFQINQVSAAGIPTTLTISPTNPSLVVGGNQNFTATVLDDTGVPISVVINWVSSNPAVGTIDPIFGYFAAVSAGTTTITATSGAATNTTTVTVTSAVPVPILTTITVSPTTATIAPGATTTLIAAGFDQNSQPMTLSPAPLWSSSDTTVATVDPNTGVVTAVAQGSATITAGGGIVAGTATITVSGTPPPPPPPPPATTFTISATFDPTGGHITFSGITTVNAGDSKTYDIIPVSTYSIADVLVDGASVGAVTTYTFSNIQANHTITATFTQGTFTVDVSTTPGGSITHSGVQTVAYGTSLSSGTYPNTYFIVTPDAGFHIASVMINGSNIGTPTNFGITYITSNQTVVVNFAPDTATNDIVATAGAGGTITPSGTTAVPFGTDQTYVITPDPGFQIDTLTIDGLGVARNPSYTFTNVIMPHTIGVTFIQSSFEITAISDPNGTIIPDGMTLSPAGVATIPVNGSVLFRMTPNPGYMLMDIIMDGVAGNFQPNGNGFFYQGFTMVRANHTIQPVFAPDHYILTASAGVGGTISPTGTISAWSGGTQNYAITPLFGYHITDVVVDGTSVGAVSSYQFTKILATHTISATFAQNISIVVTPATPSVAIGGTQQFIANAVDQSGVQLVTQPAFTWSSSNLSVGTIDPNTGIFTGVSGGTTTITATSGTITGTATITVLPPTLVLTSIAITPLALTFAAGGLQLFSASALDQNGVALASQPVIAWTSSNTSVGTIGLFTGLFNALTPGTTDITAMSGSVTITTTVTVLGTPVIAGVTNGQITNQNVTPTATGAAVLTATLDGNAFVLGTLITAEGSHILVVSNPVGLSTTVSFTIDKTAPVVAGLINNQITNYDVVPTATDATTLTTTLDGAAFTLGTAVTTEGIHTLVVTDAATNATTVNFTIDKTAPIVAGVSNGQIANQNVTPTATDATAMMATLDGVAFTLGTVVATDGNHTLVVTDAATNATTVTFMINKTVAVYRLVNVKKAQHFWTASVAEKNALVASKIWKVEGVAFSAYASVVQSGVVAISRLVSLKNGQHIWTASVTEKNSLVASKAWRLEGVAFYAFVNAQTNPVTKAVYRITNLKTGERFLTASVAEKNTLVAAVTTWRLESVAFNALP
jgi:uncharacterized protein YjdB